MRTGPTLDERIGAALWGGRRVIGLSLAMILFALFVWPTLYRYESMRYGYNSSTLIRIHRVTGTAEYLTPTGWAERVTFNR